MKFSDEDLLEIRAAVREGVREGLEDMKRAADKKAAEEAVRRATEPCAAPMPNTPYNVRCGHLHGHAGPHTWEEP